MINNQIDRQTLNRAIAAAKEKLTYFAFKDGILADFTTAFGSGFDRETTIALVNEWQNGEFDSFPEIEILPAATINGANGAYSVDTGKIYISEEFLQANANNQSAIVDLILEEYGHYVDAEINSKDAAGDEGDIFARLVTGEAIEPNILQQLKAENDRAVVTIDGQTVAIEQSTLRLNYKSSKTGVNVDASSPIFGVVFNNNPLNIMGSDHQDTFVGGRFGDYINGQNEHDYINGKSGNDNLYGGWGNDTLIGDNSNVLLQVIQENWAMTR